MRAKGINLRNIAKHEANVPVNQLYNAAKLREFTSSFKRHTIKRVIRPQNNLNKGEAGMPLSERTRQEPGDYFQVYCRVVIPQIECHTEERLLKVFLKQIENQDEKKEVEMAYHIRRENMIKDLPEDDLGAPNDRKRPPAKGVRKMDMILSQEGDGIGQHTYQDIGKYTIFPENHWKRMFPTRTFGKIVEEDYSRNETYGIMTREEGLRLTNEMHRLTLPSERNLPYKEIATWTNAVVKEEILTDEMSYANLQQDLSLTLLDYIESFAQGDERNDIKHFFMPPGIFDGIVSILIQELGKKPVRPHICDKNARMALVDQLVSKIRNYLKSTNHQVKDFSEICEVMPLIKLQLNRANLSELADLQKKDVVEYKLYMQGYHKFCHHHWRPAEIRRASFPRFKGNNTGALLWGERGCGKSQILTYCTAWAHDQDNWLNMTLSNSEDMVSGRSPAQRWKNGLYLQKPMAVQMLQDFKTSNEQMLREYQVDMSVYGKYDMTGVKDGDPEPCPRVWDPKRQMYSDQWKEVLYDVEVQALTAMYEANEVRLSKHLPDPKTMIDIIDAGIEDPWFSVNAMAEIMEQLYTTDKYKTLITIDNFNTWYQPSGYCSFRYDSNRHVSGWIPPHDLSLVRLFIKFDGHMMRNGVKICATSHHHQHNHIASWQDLNMFEGYQHRVENLSLNDFRNAMKYYHYTGFMADHYSHEWLVETKFMETQGNWNAFKQQFHNSLNIYY